VQDLPLMVKFSVVPALMRTRAGTKLYSTLLPPILRRIGGVNEVDPCPGRRPSAGNDLPESYDPVAGYEPALHASGY
jgi:hypothetical protein